MRISKDRICRSCGIKRKTASNLCNECGEKMIVDRKRRFIKWRRK